MWYIILLLITAIYVLQNYVMPGNISGNIGAYIIRPLLWITLALTVLYISKNEGLNIWKFKKVRKWEIGRNSFDAAILIGGFQIALLIIAGLFIGFGKSPYAFTPLSIITNVIFVFSLLFGIELSRAYLIKRGVSTRKNITLLLGVSALFFMFILIQPSEFSAINVNEPAESVKFIGETIIPLLAMGLFASYLAYLGGALPAIGYMGILQCFQWFSPALPDLPWALTAIIGTIAPAIGFLVIQNSIQLSYERSGRARKKMKDPALSWTAVASICLVFVFFSTGFFGVQPTVIYSGSMQPAIGVGDVVLIKEVPTDEIQTGDIIQFQRDNVTIINRVKEIYDDEDSTLYITQGDDNDDPDLEPVFSTQINGKSVFTLPKVGWISIFFKSILRPITERIS